jgi:DNA polymerase III delta prime subunit
MIHSFLERSSMLRRLRDQVESGRVHQSLLFVGPEGSGKEAAALELAERWLRPVARRAPEPAGGGGLFGDLLPPAPPPTDAHGAVRKVRTLVHSDLMLAFPIERSLTREDYLELLQEKAREPLARVRQPGSAIIPIGDVDDPGFVSVRAIRRFVQAVPFEAAHRVVIVGDAHRMNHQAANALLKTLEEPPASAVLVLCTHQPHLLPATIRSRCARITVPGLSEEELAAYLHGKHGVDPTEAARIAAVAGGNARRAFDLLDQQARELAAWGRALLDLLLAGDRPRLAQSAERVGKGQGPSGTGSKPSGDASLSVGRDIGMRVLDAVIADLVAIGRRSAGAHLDPARERSLPTGAAPDPRAANEAARILLEAHTDLARNVNVGLVLVSALLSAERALHPVATHARG